VFWQFLALGTVSVTLNTSADLVVTWFAGPLGNRIRSSARFRRAQRTATGGIMIGLGAYGGEPGGVRALRAPTGGDARRSSENRIQGRRDAGATLCLRPAGRRRYAVLVGSTRRYRVMTWWSWQSVWSWA